MKLGAGRETKDDVIDYSAGLILNKKVGSKVEKGELLITAFTNKENVNNVLEEISSAFIISKDYVEPNKIIDAIIE